MAISVFCYVEFEAFVDVGHRLNTANQYADTLRNKASFDHYCVIAPAPRVDVLSLREALCNYDSVDLSLEEMITPEFNHTNIDAVGNRLAHLLSMRVSSSEDSCIVYAHMPSPFALLALYIGVRMFADEVGSELKVLVRLCMIDEDLAWYQLRLSRLLTTIRSDPIVGSLFHFTTESHRLSSYYLERCGLDTPLQFNPFPEKFLALTANKPRHHRLLYGDHVRFAYLGEAREEKGFQYLPYLVDALRDSGIDFSLLVHAFSSPVNDTPLIRSVRETLIMRAAEGNDLRLVQFPIPDSIYAAHQYRADVIVMPYLHRAYQIRGSGVAFEAICSNAFILATEDLDFGVTFMNSERVVEYQPDQIELSKIQDVVNKVHAARTANQSETHPAQIYRKYFFEEVLYVLLERKQSASNINGTDRFLELLALVKQNLPIAVLVQSLRKAGFAIT